jgi:hypothetical protein
MLARQVLYHFNHGPKSPIFNIVVNLLLFAMTELIYSSTNGVQRITFLHNIATIRFLSFW